MHEGQEAWGIRKRVVILKNNILLYAVSMGFFGFFVLSSHQIINQSANRMGSMFYMQNLVVAIVPLLIILRLSKAIEKSEFLKKGMVAVSLFLIVSTSLLFSFAFSSREQLEKKTFPSIPNWEDKISEFSREKHNLIATNILLILIVFIALLAITCFFNFKYSPNNTKWANVRLSIIIYAGYLVYLWITMLFIYLTVSY